MRSAAIAYWLAMIISAIYLDHHWLLDALLGSAYAVLVVLVLRFAPRLSLSFAAKFATKEDEREAIA
jgi:membrane-associated phospholipid phosphatase